MNQNNNSRWRDEYQNNELQHPSQDKNAVYCVNCGSQLKSFPEPHHCIQLYGDKLQEYKNILSDYENEVRSMNKIKQEIEKVMGELETIDSKIMMANDKTKEKSDDLSKLEFRLRERMGPKPFEQFQNQSTF